MLGLRASLATTQGLLDEIRELVGCEPVDDGDTRRGIVRAVARLTHAQCECGHPRGLHFERNGALNRLVACSACACRVFRQRGGAS